MKLSELKETKKYKVIHGDINVPAETTQLNYHGTVVMGHFTCSGTKIKTLDGCPVHVVGYFGCAETKITSLQGCPRYVGDTFHCEETPITSFHNIHKMIDRVRDYMYVPRSLQSHMLGVLRIRDLVAIYLDDMGKNPKLEKALSILNSHLQSKPNPAQRDIHGCQIELIEAGLERYAQL